MSDNTHIEYQRVLLSPFNGTEWQVPPEVSGEMYDALIQRGFIPVHQKPKRKKEHTNGASEADGDRG
jgi:hypothetical protein